MRIGKCKYCRGEMYLKDNITYCPKCDTKTEKKNE